MKTTLIFLVLIASGCEARDKRVFSSTQPAVIVESKKEPKSEEVKEDDVLPESALKTESGLIVDIRVVSTEQKRKIWSLNPNPNGLVKETEIIIGSDNYQIQLENNGLKKWIRVPGGVWAFVRKGDYWNKGPE